MSLVNTIQNLFLNLKDIKCFNSSTTGYSFKYKGFVIHNEHEEIRAVPEKYGSKEFRQEHIKTCEEYQTDPEACLKHFTICKNIQDKEGVIIKLSFEPLTIKYNSQIVEGQIET